MSFNPKHEFLKKVPSHWKIRRLKEVAQVIPSNVDKISIGGQPPVLLCNYVDTYRNDRITVSIDFMKATATPAQIQRLGLAKDDVTITKDSETPWDIAIPALIAEDIPNLVCGYHLAKLSPESGLLSGRFLAWALRAKPVNVQFSLVSQGITRYGLGSSALADGLIPYPPLAEQLAIASYLDAETARIDALIAEKESLIAALAELKQVVIAEAVSFGVRPDVKLKVSGSQWFAKIPATWAIMRLKFFVRQIEQGWSPQAEARPADDNEWGVLKAGACNGGEFREDEQKALPPSIKPDTSLEVCKGDILMSRGSGSADLVGSVALVGEVRSKLMLSDLLYRLSVDDPSKTNTQWLVMALGSAPLRRQIRLSLRGAEGLTRKITTTDIRELVLAVPPLIEQGEIVAHILAELERQAALHDHTARELELLKELRSATITDAVLGRIDVRDHAKNKRAREAAV